MRSAFNNSKSAICHSRAWKTREKLLQTSERFVCLFLGQFWHVQILYMTVTNWEESKQVQNMANCALTQAFVSSKNQRPIRDSVSASSDRHKESQVTQTRMFKMSKCDPQSWAYIQYLFKYLRPLPDLKLSTFLIMQLRTETKSLKFHARSQ